MKLLLTLIMIIGCSFSGMAQDILTRKSGEEMLVKVVELTPEAVRYRSVSNPESPVLSMPVSELTGIKYQNGVTQSFAPVPAQAVVSKRTFRRDNELALNMLPVIFQSWNVFYDYRLQEHPNTAISLGVGYMQDNSGFFNGSATETALTGAAKFYLQESDFYVSPYLKYRYSSQNTGNTWHQFGGGGTVGMRHVFRGGFLLDSFLGLGSYMVSIHSQVSANEYNPTPIPVHLRLGFCVGYAF